jgi:hypothetical protein
MRSIPGFENRYSATESGEIYSHKSKRFLTPRKHTHGYSRVSLCKKDYYIHRVILMTFIGESKLEVNHKNGIKADNRLCNLEYVTSKQNKAHAWANGMYSHIGENNHMSYLTGDAIEKIRQSYAYNDNCAEVARQFGLPHKTVWNYIKNISRATNVEKK